MKTTKAPDRVELLQGTLDLLVLRTVRFGPMHGHGIAKTIQKNSDELLQVDHGSLYPALHRLERQGLLRAQWAVSERKQRTRVYRLTPRGRRHLAGERSKWEQLSAAIAGVLNRARPSET
jgi:transcriptional regulator